LEEHTAQAALEELGFEMKLKEEKKLLLTFY